MNCCDLLETFIIFAAVTAFVFEFEMLIMILLGSSQTHVLQSNRSEESLHS